MGHWETTNKLTFFQFLEKEKLEGVVIAQLPYCSEGSSGFLGELKAPRGTLKPVLREAASRHQDTEFPSLGEHLVLFSQLFLCDWHTAFTKWILVNISAMNKKCYCSRGTWTKIIL